MADLKVLDTKGLLELVDQQGVDVPNEIIERLDATGRHMFQAHSLYNTDPYDEVVHARSMFKTYDETNVDNLPLTIVHIPRARWEDMPNYHCS